MAQLKIRRKEDNLKSYGGRIPITDAQKQRMSVTLERRGATSMPKTPDDPGGKSGFLYGTAKKKEASIVSSGAGERQINKDVAFIDKTYPPKEQEKVKQDEPIYNIFGEKKATAGEELDETLQAQKTPEQLRLEDNVKQASDEVEGFIDDFRNYRVEEDPAFRAQAEQINADFDKLRREMEKTNYQRKRAYATLGFRTGATQYAGDIQMGVEGEELNQANERMAEITRQENATLAAVRDAFETRKFKQYNLLVNDLKDIREQKAKQLSGYNTSIANYTKKLQDEQDRIREQANADLKLLKLEREEAEATAENIAGVIYSSLGENASENMEYITQKALERGIDVDMLVGTVMAYEQEERENSINIETKLRTLGEKIEEGQVVEVSPGIFVTGTRKADEKWVQSIVGGIKYNDLYKEENGEYVRKQRINQGLAWKPTSPKSGTPEADKTGDWDFARELCKLNPNKTDEQLVLGLREQTKLTDSDINYLVENRKTYETAEESKYDLESLAQTLHDDYSRSEAIKAVDDYDMSDEEKETVKTMLEEKRTRLQKILPFGK